MGLECGVFPLLQRQAPQQCPSSLGVILAICLPGQNTLPCADLVALERRLEELRWFSDVQLPCARDSHPPQLGSPSSRSPDSPRTEPSAALNIEGVLGALGRMFSVSLGDSGPQMETDPLFKGRHQIPHKATDQSRQGAGTCQPEPVGLGEPEPRPALMPCC